MPYARSAECECIVGRFTCGDCLRNMKPWHWTPSEPESIDGPPFDTRCADTQCDCDQLHECSRYVCHNGDLELNPV